MTEQEPHQEPESWRFDKKIPMGALIIAFTCQSLYGLWIVADMRKDIEFQKVQFVNQALRDERQDAAGAAANGLIRAQLDRIEANQYRMAEQGFGIRGSK